MYFESILRDAIVAVVARFLDGRRCDWMADARTVALITLPIVADRMQVTLQERRVKRNLSSHVGNGDAGV